MANADTIILHYQHLELYIHYLFIYVVDGELYN